MAVKMTWNEICKFDDFHCNHQIHICQRFSEYCTSKCAWIPSQPLTSSALLYGIHTSCKHVYWLLVSLGGPCSMQCSYWLVM